MTAQAATTVETISGDVFTEHAPQAEGQLSCIPPLQQVDPAIPLVYQKVLQYLRDADASGLWPATNAKRQLVMVSKVAETTSLTMARVRAKSKKNENFPPLGPTW